MSRSHGSIALNPASAVIFTSLTIPRFCPLIVLVLRQYPNGSSDAREVWALTFCSVGAAAATRAAVAVAIISRRLCPRFDAFVVFMIDGIVFASGGAFHNPSLRAEQPFEIVEGCHTCRIF
jgi:hypothetical protein